MYCVEYDTYSGLIVPNYMVWILKSNFGSIKICFWERSYRKYGIFIPEPTKCEKQMKKCGEMVGTNVIKFWSWRSYGENRQRFLSLPS